jgi:hypothetical protein
VRKLIIGGVAAFAIMAAPAAIGSQLGTARANADDYGYSSCDDSSCTSTWNWYSPSDGGWDSSTTTCDSSGCDTY